ncbi:MAG: hypothetical protein Q8N14_04320 [Candidatus Omnitrophota bacterium]|nr:hypothetical protein [Candidatus Omnitrophota bacterium]
MRKIIKENQEFERESPYNFCDRWCERCTHEKQLRCRLYQDELEAKLTCIAHGREPDDPEITEEVMRQQFEEVEEKIEKFMEENEIELEDLDAPEFAEIKKHIELVENNPLDATAGQYRKMAQEFLEKNFYKKEGLSPQVIHDFETIAWYHTLLSAKLHRALCGFHEPAVEGDISLCDAVAQFAVCKDSIKKSVQALQNLKPDYPGSKNLIVMLVALLHNLFSRIEALEESI